MKKAEVGSEEPTKTSKRKLDRRLMISFNMPFRLLRQGSVHIRWESQQRLCYILEKLVNRGNWADASGVLSTLLKGTPSKRSAGLNRVKYWVSIMLLKHIEGNDVDVRRIRDIYEIWMSRIRSKTVEIEEKIAVSLDFILFCLTRRNLDWAHQTALSLMKEHDLINHPVSNLIVGLTCCQLWHSTLPEEFMLRDSKKDYMPEQSGTSVSKFSNQIVNSEGNYAAYTNDIASQYDSETSVMNDKRKAQVADSKLGGDVPVQNKVNVRIANLPQQDQSLGSYENSAENEAGFYNDSGYTFDPSVFSALEGLESWLMPLKLPHSSENFADLHRKMLNNHYRDSVKYFRTALHSAFPLSAALLPLVQLLLIGGQVNEALSEVERFCNNSNVIFPFRLRAILLESLCSNDYVMLSACFEDILKKDPTCCSSLAKLVSMHQNGNYSPESLVEMIALHLEATYPESSIWKELASCFIKLQHCEEDCLSVCLNGNKGEQNSNPSIYYNRTPRMFAEGKSRKAWRLRCKWWIKRHFDKKGLASEIATGDLELLTYKAACASHLYGEEFHYVVKVYSYLVKQKDRSLLKFLKPHMKNSISLNANFQEKLNII